MMKPDTPKFALVPVEPTEEFFNSIPKTVRLLGRKYVEQFYGAVVESAAPKPPQQIDLEELKRSCVEESDDHSGCMELAINWLHAKGLISVAPKPDCVGVEEAKRELGKALLAKWDGNATFGEVVQDIVDEIAERGLLGGKEKE